MRGFQNGPSERMLRTAFGDAVPVVDGGPCQVGIESTVVAVEGDRLTLLRPGMLSLGELEQIRANEGVAHPAPGMHQRHYSPHTSLLIVDGPEELPPGNGIYLWYSKQGGARPVQLPPNPQAYGMGLYAALHEADQAGVDWIAVERPPDTPEWSAILDRLQRAAGR